MPNYRYECANPACPSGGAFQVWQNMSEEPLAACPHCGQSVQRIIAPAHVRVPRSDTDLRDKGFAKLVRRDKGVYENVTALDHESRYWRADKPETMPDIKRRVTD